MSGPAPLLKRFACLFQEIDHIWPVLDLACGRGQNGLFLAESGLPYILADEKALRFIVELRKKNDIACVNIG